MRKVIGIGETILDIIFKDERPRVGEYDSGLQPIGAVPGGSVFNGVISLGRAGINAAFISETGNDRVGRKIIQFLEDNHVDANSIIQSRNHPYHWPSSTRRTTPNTSFIKTIPTTVWTSYSQRYRQTTS